MKRLKWRKENKYSRWYDDLMQNALQRELGKPYEKHHVHPISLGGDKKSETVKLTRREHFLAHWLLVKFAVGSNYRNIAYSLMMLIKLAGSCTSWRYDVAKRAVSELASESVKRQRLDPAFRKAQAEASSKVMKDLWQNQEFVEKVTKINSKIMKERWDTDPEFRARRSEASRQTAKKSWQDPDIRARTIATMKETKNTPEALAANAKQAKKQWDDPEFRYLMSDPAFLHKRGKATAKANRERIWTPEMTAKRLEKFKAFWDAKRGGPKPPRPGKAKGERSGTSKLTENNVREIRRLQGKMRRVQIAERFGISVYQVGDIQRRNSWSWLQ